MSLSLSQLWIYPVKSLAGVRVERARVERRGLARGLVHDRRFMVVGADGEFLTQRQHPRMALVRVAVAEPYLRLEALSCAPIHVPLVPEGSAREVRVWGDTCAAIDAGDDVASWISAFVGCTARLVYMPESTERGADRPYAREGDLVSFADGFPFLLLGEASIEALNERLSQQVDVRRFRPNLVVRGAPPFAEDGWRELVIGSVRFLPCKPCGRCTVVNVDPDRGERSKEPLATLASFRTREGRVLFGQNLVHDGEGEIAEGDPVIAC